tara:strand:- start:39 stop:419 length:381 start_codon:yes stop_codon:yes gene_type:complete
MKGYWNLTPHPVRIVHGGKVRLSLPKPHGFVRLDYRTEQGKKPWMPRVRAVHARVQWHTKEGNRPGHGDIVVVSSLCVSHLDEDRLWHLAGMLRPSDGCVVLAAPGHTMWHRGKRASDELRIFFQP